MNPYETQRLLWALIALVVLSILGTGGVAAYTFYEASQAHTALCAFKGNLERSVAGGETYLANHHQKVILGVPRATIERSVDKQRDTLKSLHNLSC